MSDLGHIAAPNVRRVVLHVDMNAFFVSVELLRRPELEGQPVVVGGTGRRGVVAAANYERRYGVHSAMPSMRARQLCPHAVFLAGDYDRYSEVSAEVRAIFGRFTPKIEPLSLDEAFLNVTGALRLFGGGTAIGAAIRAAVLDELQLGCSVGVAPNKYLAKMASVAAKPRATPEGIDPGPGVVEIVPGEEQRFLDPLPVRRIGGIGRVTGERLAGLGVDTVADLRRVPAATLHAVFGRAGAQRLAELARGIDDRPVESDRQVKSISHEETYRDLFDRAMIRTELLRLADGVATRLRRQELGGRTIGLKLRDAAFVTHTRARTVPSALDTESEIAAIVTDLAERLLDELEQRPGSTFPGVRLLGVVASKLTTPHQQLSLDMFGDGDAGGGDDTDHADHAASAQARSRAIDLVRERFGAAAIGAASTLGSDGVRTVRQGQHQWGHDDPPAR